jgi:beta-ureidopropionase / N-carbamoyl-L-amino-acid hydrolase
MNRREFGTALLGGTLAASTRPVVPASKQTTPLRVDGARLNTQLTRIGEFGANPQGGVTRLGYSEEDRQARALVDEWMREAGLEPRIDYAGNLIGRRAGSDPSLKPIVFGSHVDSVPEGGNFDGNVGVLAAIEAARTLGERGIALRHPIEVAVWANEEGGLFGSRAVSGQFTPPELAHVTASGKTVEEGIAYLGGDPARLDGVRRAQGDIAAYLELHIEQGGVLEEERTAIGIVEGIVGIRWWDVTVTGFANHAGTTPMNQRRDAMLGAARFVDLVNRVVTAEPGRQVGTVGRLQPQPGAPNVIPGTVVCSLELRDLDEATIERLFGRIRDESRRIGAATGTTFEYTPLHVNEPAPSDPRMRALIAESADALDLTHRVMPSGAGHDAQALAQLGPMGMMFIPSVGGISHSPKEYSHPQDIVNGANVLLGAVLAADAGDW